MVIKLLSPKDVNYLTDCKGTDYVEFLGCDHHENIYDYYLADSFINGKASYKTKGINTEKNCFTSNRTTGIRPVLTNIEDFDIIVEKSYKNEKGQLEVEYGNYAQKKSDITVRTLINGKEISNNIYVFNGKVYTIKAENVFEILPVKWLVDIENKRLISKYVIDGKQPLDSDTSFDGDFEHTYMYKYLNEEMAKKLFTKVCQKNQIYNLECNDDLISNIQQLINIGCAVLLYGDGEEEKNEILREIDSDFCNINPNDIYIPKNILEDTSRTRILKVECESANVAFDIMSNYIFPPHIKIVYSSKRKTYYNDLIIPFEIRLSVPSIFKEACEYNLHPLVYSLIIYLKDNNRLDNINAKKLIEISDILYKTNNLALLKYFVDNDLIQDIHLLSKQKILSLESILNREYILDNISKEEQAIMIPYLTSVSEDDVETVRNFIIEMNMSLLPIFDYLWSYNNEERKEIISNLNMTNSNMYLRRKRE